MHNMHASSKPVVILRLHHIFRHLDLLRPKPVQTLKYDDEEEDEEEDEKMTKKEKKRKKKKKKKKKKV